MAVKFEAKLPRNIPASAAVYQLPPVRIGAGTLRATAKSLGLADDDADVVTSTDLMAYNQGRHRVEIHRASGALAFYHRDKYGREPEKPFDLPDRRAAALSRAFLQKSKIVPLAAARLDGVTHLHSAVADVETRRVREHITDAGVVYRRTIDELLVEGPGGFATVTLDPEGEVIALRSVWRPLGKRAGKVKLKRPEEAIGELEKHVANLQGDVTVTKATLGYFELGPLDRQRVIQPVYAFVYVVRHDEVAMKSAFVAHAGDKSFGPLIGKKRFPAPVARRKKQ
jgi:hypothetical protein